MPIRARAVVCALLLCCASSAQAADKWTSPHPGIRQLTRTTSTPWRIWALEIDLCAQGVTLRATASNERKRTVSSFANLVGAEAAVNGDFFSFSTYATGGLAMGKGAAWSDTKDQTSSGLLAFGPDRLLLSTPKAVISPASWMREIVSGHPQIVSAGKPQATDPTEFCQTRHPRTAAGLSEDRRKLILAVVDGRTSISVGMKCTELAKLMHELGAYDALNLDGGGSTTMFVSGQGVVNHPSDGAERVVGNHLAVLATGAGEPGSCDRSLEESSTASDAYDGSTTSDIDGDGRADLCARSSAGISCALSNGDGLSEPIAGPALSDDSGWGDDDNWSTLRMGDIDGDGLADLCARANAGIRCWKSEGTGFASPGIVGPELSDAKGFDDPAYHGTLRMADIDADGKDDLCVRSASDFRCYPSTGDGFAEAVTLTDISNAEGFGSPSRYGTLRMGDIDADGRDDVCARAGDGMRCWLSTPSGFGPAIIGPKWADSSGWSYVGYWSTIRLADIDGDGRADLCARAAKGVICHLSEGNGFGPQIEGPTFSDDGGWWRHRYYSTLRFADLDADGDLDVCARAAKGIVCALWQDGGFGELFDGPALSDDSGWGALRFYQTIRFADLNADGRADLCARASAGVRCWLSQGTSFGEALTGPEWSDAKGWDAPKYFSTLRASGPRCLASEVCGNGSDDDCSGTIDDGCGSDGGGGAGGNGSAGASGWNGSAGDSGSGANRGSDDPSASDSGGCACSVQGRQSDLGLGLAGMLFALALCRRRR